MPEGYAGRYAREHLAAELSRHQLPFPSNIARDATSLLTDDAEHRRGGDFLHLLLLKRAAGLCLRAAGSPGYWTFR